MRPCSEATRNGKVLCVGRTYCDLFFTGLAKFPTAGEEVFSENFEIHAGGGAYITAAFLAATGAEVGLCSVLPTGSLGHEIMHEINGSSVNLSHCTLAPENEPPQVTVAISCSDDRSFLTNRSGPAVPPTVMSALNDSGLTHLHIGEIATLADNPDLAGAAKARGLTVSLDCSWDDALLKADTTKALLDDIDLFLPNEKEILALLGANGSLSECSAEIAKLAPWVVVKQSAKGATLFTDQEMLTANAVPAKLVDTTGAGDAFNAGFISAWLSGQGGAECLFSGVLTGGRAIQSIGGAGGLDITHRDLLKG